jgi:hypothetical protein
MTYIIVGNIIALIASLLMVYSGTLKKRKKLLYVQTIQIGLNVTSNLVLGGITGAIMNALGLIRNILCYKNKLRFNEEIIITIIAIILSVKFNNLGLIGLLPLISTVLYIWLMNTKNIIKFKTLIIFSMSMWFVYDLCIKSYTSSVFDFLTIIANVISVSELSRNSYLRKKHKQCCKK